MTQIATVEKIIDAEHAEISVARQSACAHDCAECGGGCGMTPHPVYAVAKNLAHAKPGDKVVVESSTKKILNVVALVYVVPFVAFFVGYAVGHTALSLGDILSGLVGAVFFAAGLIPALCYNQRMKKNGTIQYNIVRLF